MQAPIIITHRFAIAIVSQLASITIAAGLPGRPVNISVRTARLITGNAAENTPPASSAGMSPVLLIFLISNPIIVPFSSFCYLLPPSQEMSLPDYPKDSPCLLPLSSDLPESLQTAAFRDSGFRCHLPSILLPAIDGRTPGPYSQSSLARTVSASVSHGCLQDPGHW
ncbi:hypothetical protein SDC9_200148 [bioreactor metagenome]|uniref:Uncharacterized protein n=1 Tax=bioreactor metagenome TaxID=1076179 RepID=A0A645IN35_9ZZZZ